MKYEASRIEFTDAKFLSAKQKAVILRAWRRFIEGGLRRSDFFEAIYSHLSLHCAFIAHYNRHGFYEVYFVQPETKIQFLSQFDRGQGATSIEYGGQNWLMHLEYSDINNAMCAVVEEVIPVYLHRLEKEIKQRDVAIGTALLQKHGVKVDTSL